MERRRLRLHRRRLDFLQRNPELFHQLAKLGILEDHADRAGDRGFAGNDDITRGRDHVTCGSGERAHIRDNRLLFRHASNGLEDALTAIGGAAWRGNRHDQPFDIVALGDLVEPLEKFGIIGDQAGDLHAGNMGLRTLLRSIP
ncbi:hypothetical protein D3C78_1336100 [compost metagenome]